MHTCSLCKTNFEADLNNKIPSNIPIEAEIKAYLDKCFYTCLCHNCVQEIEKLELLSKQYPFPKQPNQLIKGAHYYIDGQYWVFTTLYHYQKGKCCQNGCRHCAYGYKK